LKIIYSPKLNRFEFIPQTTDEEKLAEKSGFRFEMRNGCYWTKSPELILPFQKWADVESQNRVFRHRINTLLSRATTSNGLNVPKPEGRDYLPFQLTGIAYALPRVDTLIGDDPGLGKTIQAIGVINNQQKVCSVLVICPATIKIKWARELFSWLVTNHSIGIATNDYFPPTDIVIVNYDILHTIRFLKKKIRISRKGKLAEETRLSLNEVNPIDGRMWDFLIVDESHMIKDSEASRTKAILGYSFRNQRQLPPISAKRRLFLTGTPLVNRPEDIWSLVQACDKDDLGASWDYYGKRYCKLWKAPWGWDSSGAANLEELQGRLRGSFMVRRRKSDVLTDLPPKQRQIVPLDSSKVKDLIEKGMKMYEYLKNDIQNELEIRQERIAKTVGNEEEYLKAIAELDIPAPEIRAQFQEMAGIRREESIAKVPYTIEYVKMLLQEREKLVIFAHHVDALIQLQKAFSTFGAELVYGGTSTIEERQAVIDRFQQDKKRRVAIIGITVAIGFELTSASCAVFHERDWRPSVVTQAEDRLHRIGQRDAVEVLHLVFDGSLDSLMSKQLVRKQEIIDKAVG
jgi:SNF2 family DNA or RNA helicase